LTEALGNKRKYRNFDINFVIKIGLTLNWVSIPREALGDVYLNVDRSIFGGKLQSDKSQWSLIEIIIVCSDMNWRWKYMGTDKSLARPDWKNNWKVAIFRPTDAEVIAAAEPWLDGQTSEFFWVASKS